MSQFYDPLMGMSTGLWQSPDMQAFFAPYRNQSKPIDRSIPQNQPPPQFQMPQAPVAMPQGMNQQAGLLAQNQPMNTQALMQVMQGLNSPYLKYLQGSGQ